MRPRSSAGSATPPTAAQQAIVNNILTNDLPSFHNVDLDTKRKRYDGGFTYNIDPNWQVKVSARHETKDGLKPMGTVSSQVSEFAAILPDVDRPDTDQYNASINYTSERGFVQAAYYGSVFKNDVESMTWADANDPTQVGDDEQRSRATSFHQLLLTGGYNFSPATKLVLFGSYARNTQDEAFVTVAQNNQLPLGLPTSSLRRPGRHDGVQRQAHREADRRD